MDRTSRFVEFYTGKIAEGHDPVDDADEIEEARKAAERPLWEQESIKESFTEVEGADEDLPF